MLFAHRVDELPYDAAIGAHLEQAPAGCFGDQRVAVRQALRGGARVALEEDLARALVAPDLSTGLRIALQDARAAAGAELAEIVAQQDVAVGKDVRVVLAGPVAAARPDDLIPVAIAPGTCAAIATRHPHLTSPGRGQPGALLPA